MSEMNETVGWWLTNTHHWTDPRRATHGAYYYNPERVIAWQSGVAITVRDLVEFARKEKIEQ